MAKVIFEFDDSKELKEIAIVAGRHELMYAIDRFDELYRKIVNEKVDEIEDIKNEMKNILEDVKQFLE